jgi:sugar phosphate isomerase/epimerase
MNFRLSLAHLGMLDAPPPMLVDCAAAAGFSGVGLRLAPARPGEQPFPMAVGGPMFRETTARMHDAGLTVSDVEVVRIRPGFDAHAFEPMFESAQALGARWVVTNVDDTDVDRATESLERLSALAARFGIAVRLEFMVYSATRDLTAASALVRGCGHRDTRVLLDALHFFRAGHAAPDMASHPMARDFAQINDGPPRRHPGLAASEEGRAHRLLPGEGDLPLAPLLEALDDGALLSVEAPSAIRTAQLPPRDRAALAWRTTHDFLQRSGHGLC